MHGFAEVAVGLQLIAFDHIRFRLGRSQDHGRDGFEAWIVLDISQNFASVHFGQVQVEQDQVGTRGIEVAPLPLQEGHGFHAIVRDVEPDEWIDIPESFLREAQVSGTVFDQENL